MSLNIPKTLSQKINNQQVIPLIGAGVSMSLKYKDDNRAFPSWEGLLNNSAVKLGEENNEPLKLLVSMLVKTGNFCDAAKYARDGLTGSLWYDFLKKQFSIDYQQLNSSSALLPQTIWKLSPKLITLNYDKSLQWANCEQTNVKSFDNSNKTALADFSRSTNQQPQVWHLHGHIDNPEHIILTPNGYQTLYPDDNNTKPDHLAALQTLQNTITTKCLLFIGCSLNDVELLSEFNKQNLLFSGNTGPHYALVHEDEYANIKEKLNSAGLPIELLEFSDFGAPLIDAITQLAKCRQVTLENSDSETKPHAPITIKEDTPVISRKPEDKIAFLTANPLDKPQEYTLFNKALKKFKCPIHQLSLTTSVLQESDDYSYLIIATRLTSNGLLIEDDDICSSYLSLQELEEQLPKCPKAVILITDLLPEPRQVALLKLPLLILPVLNTLSTESTLLNNFYYQLFKKHNPEYFTQGLLINKSYFNLHDLQQVTTYKPIAQETTLPQAIDKASLANFTGRESDLAALSRQLIKTEDLAQVLTIKGSGGLGKTTIVKKLILELSVRGRYSGGITFIDCEPLQSHLALELQVATAFGLQQADNLLQHLSSHHDKKSRLIVLDNIESLLHLSGSEKTNDIEKSIYFIGKISDYSSVIITSRELLGTDWEQHYTLRSLTSDEGLTLFNHATKNRFTNKEQQSYLRREILEPLLDNNPLAIKLISGSLPAGKDLKELKRELEQDFFDKVSEEDLSLFDDTKNSNINRQRSLYGSVLYSYNTLSTSEKQAFERLSLFPDGINLTKFQELSGNKNKGVTNNASNKQPINDREIKSLSDKSLLESQNRSIKLQSIINRFSEQKFQQRENNETYYQTAFEYNARLMQLIVDVGREDECKSQDIFIQHLNNICKALEYGATKTKSHFNCSLHKKFSRSALSLSSGTNTTKAISSRLKKVIQHLSFNGISDNSLKIYNCLNFSCQYFSGDFSKSLSNLRALVPLSEIKTTATEKPKKPTPEQEEKETLEDVALVIYSMEGHAFIKLLFNIKNHRHGTTNYPPIFAQLGIINSKLLALVKPDLNYFEALATINKPATDEIDKIIDGLHITSHIDKVQLNYIRSRTRPIKQKEIDRLVSINQFTRGLKSLMYAFSKESELVENNTLIDSSYNTNFIINCYQEALPELEHIKFYFMQGHYYFAKFLQRLNDPRFNDFHHRGLELSTTYHYRFWQHKFNVLVNPQLGDYHEEDYPLPENPDLSVIATPQIQYIEKRNKITKNKRLGVRS